MLTARGSPGCRVRWARFLGPGCGLGRCAPASRRAPARRRRVHGWPARSLGNRTGIRHSDAAQRCGTAIRHSDTPLARGHLGSRRRPGALQGGPRPNARWAPAESNADPHGAPCEPRVRSSEVEGRPRKRRGAGRRPGAWSAPCDASGPRNPPRPVGGAAPQGPAPPSGIPPMDGLEPKPKSGRPILGSIHSHSRWLRTALPVVGGTPRRVGRRCPSSPGEPPR